MRSLRPQTPLVDVQSRSCCGIPYKQQMNKTERKLSRELKEGLITKKEYNSRMKQSITARAEELAKGTAGIRRAPAQQMVRASKKRSSTAHHNYLMTLLDPVNYDHGLPDPYAGLPKTKKRIVTEFTMTPNGSTQSPAKGINFQVSPTMKNLVTIKEGLAMYEGNPYDSFGVNPDKFSCTDFALFQEPVSSQRLVAMQVDAFFIGTDFQNSGTLAVAEYPAWRWSNPAYRPAITYSNTAKIPWAYKGSVEAGVTLNWFPSSTPQALNWRDVDFDGAIPTGTAFITEPFLVVTGAGLFNDQTTAAAGPPMMRIVITQIFEFQSIEAILASPSPAAMGSYKAMEAAATVTAVVKADKAHIRPHKQSIWSRLKGAYNTVSSYANSRGFGGINLNQVGALLNNPVVQNKLKSAGLEYVAELSPELAALAEGILL